MTDTALAVTGLTEAQVAERVRAGLTNDVPERSSRSIKDIVRSNVFTRFNAILGILFAIILVVGPIQDGLFGLVIIANTAIGIIQEYRAKLTLDRLAVIGEARPRVRRDGTELEIEPQQVVLDDLLLVANGEKIIVDGEIAEAESLEIDESLLTGEADPVHKQPGDPVMSGSFVVAGSGSFRATKVGREAYAAQLAEEASKFTLVKSELRNGIDRILRVVTWIMIPAGLALIISQFRVDKSDLPSAIRSMVAGLVPMVPEGLVLLTSIAFAVGVIRLGAKNCLVQELPAIEGLARVDVVCADKTGTLTENAMVVAAVDILDESVDVPAVLSALGAAEDRPNASLQAIIDKYPANGGGWTLEHSVPFSSARKWSGAAFNSHGSWVLGAPEMLLPQGDPVVDRSDVLAAQGLRVLLVARAGEDLRSSESPGEVTPAALVSIEQKIRDDAADTLAYFESQDVLVKVISGDNPVTVGSVASRLGLPGADQPVDARELPEDLDQLADIMESRTVFGRVSPHQKRAMVKALQARNHTVAMTGDGVNDVLALKDADIGVCMGSGSPATRAVAQIVLLDNKFATLPSVVGEGRRVIGNIERVSNLFLTKTVYSALFAIVVAILAIKYPFYARQVTFFGSVTIGIPAFFLALAPNTERARTGFVKRVLRFAIPAGCIAAAATLISYWIARFDTGTSFAQDQVTATITILCVAFWALAIVARPYNWWKLILLACVVASLPVIMAVPFAADFFALHLYVNWNTGMALLIGAGGAVALEFYWQMAGVVRRFFSHKNGTKAGAAA